MNKFIKITKFLCFILITSMLLNCIPSVHSISQVKAAAKAKLSDSKLTIGVESMSENVFIYNEKVNAKYSFTSKNKKIATVDKYGSLTGVSKGRTDIVVKETYKGKTTIVGTCKITVVLSNLITKKFEISAFESTTPPIKYYNFKAKYSFVYKDKSIFKIDKYSYITGLKEGSTTVTVTETYKNTKRNLGSFIIDVKMPSISKNSQSIDIGLNATTDPISVISIDNHGLDSKISYESANSNIVSVTTEPTEWEDIIDTSINGVSLGTTELTLYVEYDNQKYKLGKVHVTVKESLPVTAFQFHNLLNDEIALLIYDLGWDEYNTPLTYYIISNPVNTTTPITFTSSDENVATVDNSGNVTTISEGTTIITATCGPFTDEIKIGVERLYE